MLSHEWRPLEAANLGIWSMMGGHEVCPAAMRSGGSGENGQKSTKSADQGQKLARAQPEKVGWPPHDAANLGFVSSLAGTLHDLAGVKT